MSLGYGRRGAGYGGRVALVSELENASPHRVVQMLLVGALKQVARARGAMERGETARKGEAIGKVIGIIEYLNGVLDMEAGEVSSNLAALYEYALARLSHANLKNDAAALVDVAAIIGTIKEGWDGIADSDAAQVAGPAGSLALVSGKI